MSHKTWTRKQGQSSGLIIIVIGVILACILVYYYFNPPIPADFDPGIKLGEGVFAKILFYENSKIDYVSDIEFGELHSHPGLEYCIVGNMGTAYIDVNLHSLEFIEFQPERYPIGDRQICIWKDGKCYIRDTGRDERGRFRFNDKHYFELNGQDFPLVYEDNEWVAAKGTDQEIRFSLPFSLVAKGTDVFFQNSDTPYYAILIKKTFPDPVAGFKLVRLDLYIFDSQKQLIYNEILADETSVSHPALKAVLSRDLTGDFLLVGGAGKVWKYTLSDQKANPAEFNCQK